MEVNAIGSIYWGFVHERKGGEEDRALGGGEEEGEGGREGGEGGREGGRQGGR